MPATVTTHMPDYFKSPLQRIPYRGIHIDSFITEKQENIDNKTVESFGEEWENFHAFSDTELKRIGDEYFDIIDQRHLNAESVVLDVGCGSGRWSRYIAPKVKRIEAIDPSKAIFSAVDLTKDCGNVRVTQAATDTIPFADNSFDFVFSLGVLHHIPDTQKAMKACVSKLKPGGYFLVYLYYNLEGRSVLFKSVFHIVNFIRKIVSSFPAALKRFVCDIIAVLVYWPFARFALLLKKLGVNAYKKVPLSYYHDKSFYIMRNDSLDRFGTPLEQRFSKEEIKTMMENCGLTNIVFSEKAPYWHAVGKKG
jgi:SAM-dependent methyltransferase